MDAKENGSSSLVIGGTIRFRRSFSSCKICVSGVMLSLTNDVVDWDKCVLSSVER